MPHLLFALLALEVLEGPLRYILSSIPNSSALTEDCEKGKLVSCSYNTLSQARDSSFFQTFVSSPILFWKGHLVP